MPQSRRRQPLTRPGLKCRKQSLTVSIWIRCLRSSRDLGISAALTIKSRQRGGIIPMAINVAKLKNTTTPMGMPFRITKLGPVVVQVSDLERSVNFYTQILGFKLSDVYPEEMMPGGMVFLRCNTDHHCLALVGAGDGKNANRELHHLAFEVPPPAEVLRARAPLRPHGARIDFEGRRR